MNGHNLIIYNDNIITTTITGSSLHSSCGCCVFIAKRLMRFQLWSKKLLIKYWENDNNIPFSKLDSKNTPKRKVPVLLAFISIFIPKIPLLLHTVRYYGKWLWRCLRVYSVTEVLSSAGSTKPMYFSTSMSISTSS
jgi:hypothetical protein